MNSRSQFQPDWVSAPGETINALLQEQSLTVADFAQLMNSSEVDAVRLLNGEMALSEEIACALEDTLGGSVSFWLCREQQYRDDADRIRTEESREQQVDWLRALPLSDMRRFGWIEYGRAVESKLTACMQFFGVRDLVEWEELYEDMVSTAAYRTSSSFDADAFAVISWLRQGELVASKFDTAEWDITRFEDSLEVIRKLSKLKDPNVFVPKLRSICAEAGVSLALVRAPKGCRASGATRFLPNGKPLIMLSFRYLTDDHFWFTFFHEAAHLILHAETPLHLEGLDACSLEEEEANRYAALTLIPAHMQEELLELSTDRKSIMRFGVRAQISAGIVVGQLQHLGHLGPGQMNWLKKRYNWSQIQAD